MAKRRSRNPIATPRHAILFFLFSVAGAVLLGLAKVANLPNGFEAGILVCLSVSLMLTYCLFVTLVPATLLRIDVAADNMYYLGFLYTLSSLAIALMVDETDSILANFGVAISSTLIGMAARVSLSQLRVDPHDVEAASRLELSEATSRIRAELDETVQQLTTFRTMNFQAMAEGYEEVRNNVDNAAVDIFSAIQKLVQKSEEPLRMLAEKATTANEQAIESIEALTESSRDITKAHVKMVPQVDKATKALQDLSEYYTDKGIIDEKMLSAVRIEIEKLQTVVTREARDEFKNLAEATDKARLASENVGIEQAKLANNSVEEIRKTSLLTRLAKEASERFEKIQAQFKKETQVELESINEKIDNSIQAVEKIEAQQSQLAAKAAADMKSVSAVVDKSSETSSKIENVQNQLKQETQTELKSINEKIDNSIQAVEKIKAQQSQLAAKATDDIKSVGAVVDKSSEISSKIENVQIQLKQETQTELKSINEKIDNSIQTSRDIEENVKIIADRITNLSTEGSKNLDKDPMPLEPKTKGTS
mgnify:CR=1 FL=1